MIKKVNRCGQERAGGFSVSGGAFSTANPPPAASARPPIRYHYSNNDYQSAAGNVPASPAAPAADRAEPALHLVPINRRHRATLPLSSSFLCFHFLFSCFRCFLFFLSILLYSLRRHDLTLRAHANNISIYQTRKKQRRGFGCVLRCWRWWFILFSVHVLRLSGCAALCVQASAELCKALFHGLPRDIEGGGGLCA